MDSAIKWTLLESYLLFPIFFFFNFIGIIKWMKPEYKSKKLHFYLFLLLIWYFFILWRNIVLLCTKKTKFAWKCWIVAEFHRWLCFFIEICCIFSWIKAIISFIAFGNVLKTKEVAQPYLYCAIIADAWIQTIVMFWQCVWMFRNTYTQILIFPTFIFSFLCCMQMNRVLWRTKHLKR